MAASSSSSNQPESLPAATILSDTSLISQLGWAAEMAEQASQVEAADSSNHAGGPIRTNETKKSKKECTFPGCAKLARDARTRLCAKHGGGARCEHPGCGQAAANSKAKLCLTHGGGQRCVEPDCDKAARSGSMTCAKHGGGRTCDHEGCNRMARPGKRQCISHGGGTRCSAEGCLKAARGACGRCEEHGGLQRFDSARMDPEYHKKMAIRDSAKAPEGALTSAVVSALSNGDRAAAIEAHFGVAGQPPPLQQQQVVQEVEATLVVEEGPESSAQAAEAVLLPLAVPRYDG